MKTRKTLFLLSAIALSIRVLWGIIRLTPWMQQWYLNHIWGHPIRVEIFWLPYTWLLLGGILLAAAAFLVRGDAPQPVPKLHRFSTYALAVLSLVTLIAALVHSVRYYGVLCAWAPDWLNMLLLIAGCAWVWMLAVHPCTGNVSKGLRIAIWCSIGLILLLLLLQLISGISYIVVGHIQFFHSHAIGHLLRYLIPAVLLCYYSMELMKHNNRQSELITFAILLAGLTTCFSSCGKFRSNTNCATSTQDDSTWAQELSQSNLFANDTNYISVIRSRPASCYSSSPRV